MTVPTDRVAELVERVRARPGVVGVSAHLDVSIDPPGSLVTALASNDASRQVLKIVREMDMEPPARIIVQRPRALVLLPPRDDPVQGESNETLWEESAFEFRSATHVSANYIVQMLLSGGIAAVGLSTDRVHIIVAAMLVAMAFAPLVRVPFGIIAGPRVSWRRGVLAAVVAYACLAAGGATWYGLLRAIAGRPETAIWSQPWVAYFSTLTWEAAVLALLAGVVGTLSFVAHRTTLAEGVMIALALVPSMALCGMASAAGQWDVAWQGLLRWSVDVTAVIVAAFATLWLKQRFTHRRRGME